MKKIILFWGLLLTLHSISQASVHAMQTLASPSGTCVQLICETHKGNAVQREQFLQELQSQNAVMLVEDMRILNRYFGKKLQAAQKINISEIDKDIKQLEQVLKEAEHIISQVPQKSDNLPAAQHAMIDNLLLQQRGMKDHLSRAQSFTQQLLQVGIAAESIECRAQLELLGLGEGEEIVTWQDIVTHNEQMRKKLLSRIDALQAASEQQKKALSEHINQICDGMEKRDNDLAKTLITFGIQHKNQLFEDDQEELIAADQSLKMLARKLNKDAQAAASLYSAKKREYTQIIEDPTNPTPTKEQALRDLEQLKEEERKAKQQHNSNVAAYKKEIGLLQHKKDRVQFVQQNQDNIILFYHELVDLCALITICERAQHNKQVFVQAGSVHCIGLAQALCNCLGYKIIQHAPAAQFSAYARTNKCRLPSQSVYVSAYPAWSKYFVEEQIEALSSEQITAFFAKNRQYLPPVYSKHLPLAPKIADRRRPASHWKTPQDPI